MRLFSENADLPPLVRELTDPARLAAVGESQRLCQAVAHEELLGCRNHTLEHLLLVGEQDGLLLNLQPVFPRGGRAVNVGVTLGRLTSCVFSREACSLLWFTHNFRFRGN